MKKKLLSLLGAWLALAVSAWAAPTVTNTYVNQTVPRADSAQIVNGSSTVSLTATTNYVTLATSAAQGTDLTGLFCLSNDTVSHNISFVRINGSNLYPLAVCAISAATSTALGTITSCNTTGPANPIQAIAGTPVDPYGNSFIRLANSDNVKIGVLTTVVTSGDVVACSDVGGDYQ